MMLFIFQETDCKPPYPSYPASNHWVDLSRLRLELGFGLTIYFFIKHIQLSEYFRPLDVALVLDSAINHMQNQFKFTSD